MSRWELAAGGAIGLGAGALLYRYLVLGPDWQGPGALALPACAIGLIVAGARGVQRLAASTRPRAWQRAAAIVPGVAVGFAIAYLLLPAPGHVALHERTIGALTIGLPDGDSAETPAMITIDRAGGGAGGVGVVWRTATYEPATIDAMIGGAGRGMGGRAEPVADDFTVGDGLPHRAATLRKDDVAGWVAVFACGDRVFGVFALGDGAEALERRVLASARCAATPARP